MRASAVARRHHHYHRRRFHTTAAARRTTSPGTPHPRLSSIEHSHQLQHTHRTPPGSARSRWPAASHYHWRPRRTRSTAPKRAHAHQHAATPAQQQPSLRGEAVTERTTTTLDVKSGRRFRVRPAPLRARTLRHAPPLAGRQTTRGSAPEIDCLPRQLHHLDGAP